MKLISLTSGGFKNLLSLKISFPDLSEKQFSSCETEENPVDLVKKMFKLRSIALNLGCSC